jgi:hypothetical protein
MISCHEITLAVRHRSKKIENLNKNSKEEDAKQKQKNGVDIKQWEKKKHGTSLMTFFLEANCIFSLWRTPTHKWLKNTYKYRFPRAKKGNKRRQILMG